jgi:hypothetical protein
MNHGSGNTAFDLKRRVIRPREAAKIFGVCRATVWNRIKDGSLRSKVVGRCRLIDLESAEKLFLGTPEAA